MEPTLGFEPRTCALRKRGAESATLSKSIRCDELKTPLSCELTVSHDKPPENPSTGKPAELPADLAEIVSAWPAIPDQIKAAVKAVLAPYMTGETAKEGLK